MEVNSRVLFITHRLCTHCYKVLATPNMYLYKYTYIYIYMCVCSWWNVVRRCGTPEVQYNVLPLCVSYQFFRSLGKGICRMGIHKALEVSFIYWPSKTMKFDIETSWVTSSNKFWISPHPSFMVNIFQFLGMWFERMDWGGNDIRIWLSPDLMIMTCHATFTTCHPGHVYPQAKDLSTTSFWEEGHNPNQPHQKDIYFESNPYSGQNPPLPSSMRPYPHPKTCPSGATSYLQYLYFILIPLCQQVTCWHPRRSASGRQSQSKSRWNLGRKLPRRPGLAMASLCRKQELEDSELRYLQKSVSVEEI